jgi:hypothetical protein
VFSALKRKCGRMRDCSSARRALASTGWAASARSPSQCQTPPASAGAGQPRCPRPRPSRRPPGPARRTAPRRPAPPARPAPSAGHRRSRGGRAASQAPQRAHRRQPQQRARQPGKRPHRGAAGRVHPALGPGRAGQQHGTGLHRQQHPQRQRRLAQVELQARRWRACVAWPCSGSNRVALKSELPAAPRSRPVSRATGWTRGPVSPDKMVGRGGGVSGGRGRGGVDNTGRTVPGCGQPRPRRPHAEDPPMSGNQLANNPRPGPPCSPSR